MKAATIIELARPSEWHGIVPKRSAGKFVAMINCTASGCEASKELTWRGRTPHPEIVVAKMRRAGWRVGKSALCPACQRRPIAAALAPLLEQLPMEGIEMGDTTVKPSPAAKSARLAALDYLRDEFDADRGRYREGASDATIAEITGLSPDAVKALREEWFGELREPPEVAELRALLTSANVAAETAHATAKAALRDAETALDIVKRAGENLATVCRKHGWTL